MAAWCQLLHGMQCMVGIPPLPSDTHGIAWCKEHLAMERWLPGVNFCRRLVVDCRHWRWINFCGRTCAFVHHVHGYMGNYVHHHQVHHVHVPPCTPCAIMYTITMFIMYMCTTRVPPSPLILLRSCLIRQMRSGHSFYGECELIANDEFNIVFVLFLNWI